MKDGKTATTKGSRNTTTITEGLKKIIRVQISDNQQNDFQINNVKSSDENLNKEMYNHAKQLRTYNYIQL